MMQDEKIKFLQDNHFGLWLKTRETISEELSSKQSMFCVCGKLATGLHELNCRKFNQRVNSETAQKLSHLLNISK